MIKLAVQNVENLVRDEKIFNFHKRFSALAPCEQGAEACRRVFPLSVLFQQAELVDPKA
jgi:hypothetical protein